MGGGRSLTLYLSPSCPPRLALYVYEYLLHVGAQKSAQTFLSEVRGGGQHPRTPPGPSGGPGAPSLLGDVTPPPSPCPSVQIRWEKNITLGEPPGFLHSWWW